MSSDPFNLLFDMFHGSIEDSVKSTITKSFADQNGAIRVLFATLAFGMGVDSADLHHIIHYGPPKGIDDLCQETDRAGRDGQQSHAKLIVYPKSSVTSHISLILAN